MIYIKRITQAPDDVVNVYAVRINDGPELGRFGHTPAHGLGALFVNAAKAWRTRA